jgi:hypothetical protein
MSLSALTLALLFFFLAAGWFGWFAVSPLLLGVLAILAAILLLVEGTPLGAKFVKRQ